MKENYSSAKVVATAALLGNVNAAIIKRMAMYITERTVDNNIICSILQGLAIDAKVVDKNKLIDIVGSYFKENICDIIDVNVDICQQYVDVKYSCVRFAEKEDETRSYKTVKEQTEVYNHKVKVIDCVRIDINGFDWNDSIQFEVI